MGEEEEYQEMMDYLDILLSNLERIGYDPFELEEMTVQDILDCAMIEMSFRNS